MKLYKIVVQDKAMMMTPNQIVRYGFMSAEKVFSGEGFLKKAAEWLDTVDVDTVPCTQQDADKWEARASSLLICRDLLMWDNNDTKLSVKKRWAIKSAIACLHGASECCLWAASTYVPGESLQKALDYRESLWSVYDVVILIAKAIHCSQKSTQDTEK